MGLLVAVDASRRMRACSGHRKLAGPHVTLACISPVGCRSSNRRYSLWGRPVGEEVVVVCSSLYAKTLTARRLCQLGRRLPRHNPDLERGNLGGGRAPPSSRPMGTKVNKGWNRVLSYSTSKGFLFLFALTPYCRGYQDYCMLY
ncbi:hypothetical protein Salat_1867300 [Sesamum alatum]|uniref:Uncharacterized protein n=1 Tax=Sesamum alatum TaxID=300844 RepID=A0AAE1Y3Y6_9LAMI|nr:hypothetical protein Salat_1867300 [Sesamum alatum]